jgi:hypothetical protein
MGEGPVITDGIPAEQLLLGGADKSVDDEDGRYAERQHMAGPGRERKGGFGDNNVK